MRGIKLALLAKINRLLSKSRGTATKTKASYNNLDVPGKVSTSATVLVNNWRVFIFNIRTILKKPVRQMSHFGLIAVIVVVLFSGVAAPETTEVNAVGPVDPFGMIKSTAVINDDVNPDASELEGIAAAAVFIDEAIAEEVFSQIAAGVVENKIMLAGASVSNNLITTTESSSQVKTRYTKYVIRSGDTLSGIAQKFSVTTNSIKWSNFSIKDIDSLKPGDSINIPSVTGIIYTVKSGDTIDSIASKYKSKTSLIIAQNDLYGESLVKGMTIIIPGGQVDEPKPTPTRIASSSVPTRVYTYTGPNRFPYGYCTWYVASKRYIPWNGNAWQWYNNAVAYGRKVGRVPVAGAIMVTWESSIGHVAYIESVNGNSFTVSEMNYRGYGVVSRRTITVNQVSLIGFIY